MYHKTISASSLIAAPPPAYRSGRGSVASNRHSVGGSLASSSRTASTTLPRYASHDPIYEQNRKHSIYSHDFAYYRFDRKASKASVAFERGEQIERLPAMSSNEGRRPSVVDRRASVRRRSEAPKHTPAEIRNRNIFYVSLTAVLLLIVFILAYKRIEQDCAGQVDRDFCKWGGWTDKAGDH